ncbi:hypothetical protein MMC30_002914 [Trapelia coarctata]|nr:hypothetical protein [Trapelia coarctata]
MGQYTIPNDSPGSNNNGETGGLIEFNIPTYMLIAAFTAVAWFNTIELNILVFVTFKRHRGLYFWSLIIPSFGCLLHALGFVLKFFQLTTYNSLSVTIITVGWYAMVTGQSLVLYSRLHIVENDDRVLRGVLIMIIFDAICLHIPTTVLTYGSNSNGYPKFLYGFNIMERLQMTGFCIQEFIISSIYVYETIKVLGPAYQGRARSVMMQLIWINLVIIAMDVVLLTMEYMNHYEIEATLKAMVYSIKLKLEFAVLNQLRTLSRISVLNAQHLTWEGPAAAQKEKDLYSKPRSKSLSHMLPWSGQGRNDSTSTEGTSSSQDSFNARSPSWVPSFNRHQSILEPQPMEAPNSPPNVFTNPAAIFNRSHRNDYAPRDPPSPMSPTFSGPVLNDHPRRAPESPPLNISASPPARGVLRSDRLSVSDLAHEPHLESRSSSEAGIDPDE